MDSSHLLLAPPGPQSLSVARAPGHVRPPQQLADTCTLRCLRAGSGIHIRKFTNFQFLKFFPNRMPISNCHGAVQQALQSICLSVTKVEIHLLNVHLYFD